MKEIILVVAVLASIILIYISLKRVRQSNLSSGAKTVYTYLTVLFPPLGFFLTMKLKKQQ